MKWIKYTRFRIHVYHVIDETQQRNVWGSLYNTFMVLVIMVSLVPLLYRTPKPWFFPIEKISVTVFIIDYLLRWATADIKSHRPAKEAFFFYPFTAAAIVDLLSILPGLSVMSRSFKIFRISRLFKIFRVAKLFRYSNNIMLLMRVLQKERKTLTAVLFLAIFYIFTTALIMFNAEEGESEMFSNFFDAVYWATTTLTTVGYGDIYPTGTIGRVISMCSSLFGVAIIALPSGIITASYMQEIQKNDQEELKTKEEQKKQLDKELYKKRKELAETLEHVKKLNLLFEENQEEESNRK